MLPIFLTPVTCSFTLQWPATPIATATQQSASQAGPRAANAASSAMKQAQIEVGTWGAARLVSEPQDVYGPGCPPLLLGTGSADFLNRLERAAQARSPWRAGWAQLIASPTALTASLVGTRPFVWLHAKAPVFAHALGVVLGYVLLPIHNGCGAFVASFVVFSLRVDLAVVRKAQQLCRRWDEQASLSKNDIKEALSFGSHDLKNRDPLSVRGTTLWKILGQDMYAYALDREPQLTMQQYNSMCDSEELRECFAALAVVALILMW